MRVSVAVDDFHNGTGAIIDNHRRLPAVKRQADTCYIADGMVG